MSPIPQTSFLVWTFFAVSYSKPALELTALIYILWSKCCFPSVTLQKSSERREDDNRGNSFWHAEITKGLNSEPIKLSVTSENIWAPSSTYLLTEAKTNFRYCQAQYATTKCFFHNKHSVLLFFHSNKEKYLLILFCIFHQNFFVASWFSPKVIETNIFSIF